MDGGLYWRRSEVGGKRVSFKRKVFFSFVVIIAIPTLIILMSVMNLSLSYYRARFLQSVRSVCELSARAVDIKLRAYRQMTMQIYYNRDLMTSVLSLSRGRAEPEDVMRVAEFLKSLVNSDRHIVSAYIAAGSEILYQGLPFQESPELMRMLLRESEPDSTIVWVPTARLRSVFGGETAVFGVLRQLRIDNRDIGSLLLLVRETVFDDVYESIAVDEGEQACFVDANGVVLSGMGTLSVGSSFVEMGLIHKASEVGWAECPVTGGPGFLIAATANEAEWYFVILIPRDRIMRSVSGTRQVFMLVVVLFAVFIAILSYLFSRGLARPIEQLIGVIERIGEEELVVPHELDDDDEIGRIGRSVTAMMARISALLERVKEEERQKNIAQLKTLQMQMNPHFLYNTLNTIRWMAEINRQDNIKEMIGALIRLMRSAASTDTFLIPLREELTLLDSYLRIQRARFPDFEVRIRAPENLLHHRIVKFALQTVVENSIVHGFRGRESGGLIEILVSQEGDFLLVTVCDNGVGFEPASLDDAGDEQDGEHAHTGLMSLRSRIRLYHGARYGVSIASAPGEGTRVQLRLPVLSEGGTDPWRGS